MPRTDGLEATIIRRLRAGERAKRVAADLRLPGVTPGWVYRIAAGHDITLRRGRPAFSDATAYARHFDATHGPGAAAAWRRLRNRLTLEELGAKFGYRTRARTHEVDQRLCPGTPKPFVRRSVRPRSVASLRRTAQRCKSKRAVARQLHVSEDRLNSWGQHYRIALPDGRRLKKERGDALRRTIRRLGRRGYNMAAIARIIHRHYSVVYFWNWRYHLGLRRRPYRRRSTLSAA